MNNQSFPAHLPTESKTYPKLYWSDKNIGKIVVLSLVSDADYPYWDVSYCRGVTKKGVMVDIGLPFSQLNKKEIKAQILQFARDENVYAKGLGLFDAIVTFA